MVLVGSPEGLDLTVSEGIVSARRESGEGYQLLQTSAPASPGSSGGGMFNEYGELIGIVTLQYPEGQNLNFAIPINYARGLISTDTTMTLEELAELVSIENTNSSSGLNEVTASSLDLDNNAKLSAIIDSSGLNFEELSGGNWRTTFEGGEYMNEITVTVGIYDDDFVLVLGATPDPETEWTTSQLKSLLDLNYNLDLAKVGFNPDGSVWALTEVALRTLDGQILDVIAYSVALAAMKWLVLSTHRVSRRWISQVCHSPNVVIVIRLACYRVLLRFTTIRRSGLKNAPIPRRTLLNNFVIRQESYMPL